jgi:hypothetical protein
MVVRVPLWHLRQVLVDLSSVPLGPRAGNYCPRFPQEGFDMHTAFRVKNVFVRAYIRMRFGKLENVSQHFRSAPHQYVLFA